MTSSRVENGFWVITFDWDEIQASNQLQSVFYHQDESTDMLHDLIGSGHDLDLRSNLRNDLLGQIIHHSTRLDERKTMVLSSHSTIFTDRKSVV